MNPEAGDPRNENLLAGLFGDEVLTLASAFHDPGVDVSEAERALVRDVVRKRELEFLTGRSLARQLLRDLGQPDADLLRDSDRVPEWPDGVVGSITHSTLGRVSRSRSSEHEDEKWLDQSLCIVAIARGRDRAGLGIDVEPDRPVKAGLEAEICRPAERAWAEAAGAVEAGRRCRIIFSIKEAVYKAFYPRVREVWGFHDVGVQIDLEGEAFGAVLPPGAGRAEVEGRVVCRQGWIVSGVDYR